MVSSRIPYTVKTKKELSSKNIPCWGKSFLWSLFHSIGSIDKHSRPNEVSLPFGIRADEALSLHENFVEQHAGAKRLLAYVLTNAACHRRDGVRPANMKL